MLGEFRLLVDEPPVFLTICDEIILSETEAAVRWFRRSAEQGHPSGQADLGWMYENGRGVQRDRVEAVRWYRRAADQGPFVGAGATRSSSVNSMVDSTTDARRETFRRLERPSMDHLIAAAGPITGPSVNLRGPGTGLPGVLTPLVPWV